MTSDAFTRFKAGIPLPADPTSLTYDIDAFQALEGPERAQAVALLLERISLRSDVRAMNTAAVLKLSEAEAALRAQSESTQPYRRGAALRAINAITGAASDREALTRDSTQAPTSVRLMNAFHLSRSDNPEDAQALRPALYDKERITRGHAVNGIYRLTGLDALNTARQSVLGTIRVRLFTDLPSVYRRAADELNELLFQMDTGAAVDELGLEYIPDPDPAPMADFFASAQQPEYDLDALRRMTPQDRDWSEAMLVAALQRREAKAARALAELPVPWALDALLDASLRAPLNDEFAQAVKQARSTLGSVFH